MAKFAMFNSGASRALDTVEGDYMQQDKEFVKIFKAHTGNRADEQVAAFHLDRGQLVKKISD